jgi:hypothetical protein
MKVKDLNWSENLRSGFIAINPDTPQYKLTESVLTYEFFDALNLRDPIYQIKFLIDGKLNLPLIKVTSQNQSFFTLYSANANDIAKLCVNIFRAHLIAESTSFWFPYRPSPSVMSGILMKRAIFSKKFLPVSVTIDPFGLYE